MTTIRELITKIGFDIDDAALKRAGRAIEDLKGSLTRVGAVVTAAAGGILLFGKNIGKTGEDIIESAKEIGLTTDALQEFRYAADLAGVSSEELQSGFQAFSRKAGDAAFTGTGPFIDRLQSLGISLTDANDNIKPMDLLLEEVSNALLQVTDATEQSAISMDLFNRSSRRLTNFLSKGSAEIALMRNEAVQLGVVMNKEAVQAAADLDDQFDRLGATFRGIKNQVGASLIPLFREIADEILNWVKANRTLIKQKFENVVANVIKVLKVLWHTLSALGSIFSAFALIVGGTENALYLLIGAIVLVNLWPLIAAAGVLAKTLWMAAAGILAMGGGFLIIPIAITAAVVGIALLTNAILDWLGITDSTTDEAGSLWGMFKDNFLTIIGVIFGGLVLLNAGLLIPVAAIGILGYGLYKLYEIFKEFPVSLDIVIANVRMLWEMFLSWMQAKINPFVEWFNSLSWDGFVNAFINAFGKIADYLSSVFMKVLDGVIEKIKYLLSFADYIPGVKAVKTLVRIATQDETKQRIATGAAVTAAASQSLPSLNSNQGGGMGAVASQQLAPRANNVNSNRSLTVKSEVNVNIPPGTASSSLQEESLTASIKQAWGDMMDRMLEEGYYNNAELE